MDCSYEVLEDSLIQISDELFKTHFISNDIYSLLMLALMTIITYSIKRNKLSPQNRIDLIIAFLPDLIDNLTRNKMIDGETAKSLMRQCELRRYEIPLILRAYIHIHSCVKT